MTHAITLRRYLWTLLVAGTAASVAANVAHAHPGIGPRIMAVAAPVALLAFTHLVGLWGRIRTSGATYWAILVTVALIAAGAARVSFAAVRDLAVSYGYGPLDAALIPLMLDGGLAVTALALVVLSRVEAEAGYASDHQTDDRLILADQSVITEPDHPLIDPITADQPVDIPLIDAGQEDDQRFAGPGMAVLSEVSVATDEQPDDHSMIARLISATGRTQQPVEVITAVLAARAEGAGLKAAGMAAGVTQGTVKKIVDLAEEVAA